MIALMYYAILILMVKRWVERDKNSFVLHKEVFYSLGFGACLYIAYNIRTVYLIPEVILVIILVFLMVKSGKYQNIGFVFTGILCGCCIAAWPQMIINQQWYGVFSPMVFTGYGSKDNLFVAQLSWGIQYPRYETYVGDGQIYPYAGMFFSSPAGVLASAEAEINTISDFIIWVFTHFLQACGLYFEHCISGITIFYTEVYIEDINVNVLAYVLNCGLFLITFTGIVASGSILKKMIVHWPVFILIIPAILTMPGALEIRFFLPIYVLIYCYFGMKMDFRKSIQFVKKNPWWILVCFLIFTMWCMVANNLLCYLQEANLSLSNQFVLEQQP